MGRAQYSMICAPDGGIIDDLIVYRLAEDRFLVVANASNAQVVSDALPSASRATRAVLDDQLARDRPVAVQGPRSADVLAPLTDVDLASLRYYAIAEGTSPGSRAGRAHGIYGRGRVRGLRRRRGPASCGTRSSTDPAGGRGPVGLGARDTLRLEAGMPLYGNELDRTTNPYEAGLGRVVKLDEAGRLRGTGGAREGRPGRWPARRLVGLVHARAGIARHGYPVHAGDRRTGVVTSGTQSPTLGVPIAMAYVAPRRTMRARTSRLEVEIR
jgi:aminomethyltransferase